MPIIFMFQVIPCNGWRLVMTNCIAAFEFVTITYAQIRLEKVWTFLSYNNPKKRVVKMKPILCLNLNWKCWVHFTEYKSYKKKTENVYIFIFVRNCTFADIPNKKKTTKVFLSVKTGHICFCFCKIDHDQDKQYQSHKNLPFISILTYNSAFSVIIYTVFLNFIKAYFFCLWHLNSKQIYKRIIKLFN